MRASELHKGFIKAARALATRRLVITFDKVDFTYTDLSWKRLKNWLLAELSCALGSRRAWAYPTHLQIEPTNLCNLQCPVCHVVTDGKEKGMLSLADFKKLIDEVGEYILFLHLWGWGEPFMNREFISMVRYAKSKGLKMVTSTNGHFFEDEDDIDRLIDSGLDVLIFALDAVDAGTYEKYRKRGDFDKALRGLKSLIERRAERQSPYPIVNLRMLVTRDNEHQVPGMKKLAREIGVDILTLKTLNSFDNEAEGACLLPRDPAYRRFTYGSDGRPILCENSCKKLWNHPTVYRDGTVVPCDYHTGLDLSLGNVFSDSVSGFRRVWFGESFRRLRTRFVTGDREGLRCATCALNFAGVDRCVSHFFHFPSDSRGVHGARTGGVEKSS